MGNITDERASQSDIEQVKEKVQDVADQAKVETRDRLNEQIDTRSTQAGEQVSSTARAIRGAGDQLRSEGNTRAADVVDAVADRSERLGAYLSTANSDRLLRDLEDFARRQPWLVAGAGALAGFLTARFVKASSGSRYAAGTSDRYALSSGSAVPTAGGSSGVG